MITFELLGRFWHTLHQIKALDLINANETYFFLLKNIIRSATVNMDIFEHGLRFRIEVCETEPKPNRGPKPNWTECGSVRFWSWLVRFRFGFGSDNLYSVRFRFGKNKFSSVLVWVIKTEPKPNRNRAEPSSYYIKICQMD